MSRSRYRGWRAAFSVLAVTVFVTSVGWAQQETVLHSFGGGTNGTFPAASLIFDSSGNLYGTTAEGGIHTSCGDGSGCGTAFELSPKAGGGWTETVLHSFGNGTDGIVPDGSLLFDQASNLYGTTVLGGIHGLGTAFELSPRQGGGWTETILHSFGNGTDGISPNASLIFDSNGNLYGTTYFGGIHGQGTVFELSPSQGGGWTETVLHSFGSGTDGAQPYAALILDMAGNLYSTTYKGGVHGEGTVFELSPRLGGGWTETVLHSFGNPATQDGADPFGDLVADATGNLYGMTQGGGIRGKGTVFELSLGQGGGWTETVLHSFGNPATQDGANPFAGLIFDQDGNLYGTTYLGGIHSLGTAFELSPSGGGGWTETVLHSFGVPGSQDGSDPEGGLIFDRSGNLYGTTMAGGIHVDGVCSPVGCGTVFELSPREGGGWTETVLHSFGNGTDGIFPQAGLVSDAVGNLYGTTESGGIHSMGTTFTLTPREGGGWTETVLHSFGNGTDGAFPVSGLTFDSLGNLYSTTLAGGIHGLGTAFQLTP